jgi:hypothetical protein
MAGGGRAPALPAGLSIPPPPHAPAPACPSPPPAPFTRPRPYPPPSRAGLNPPTPAIVHTRTQPQRSTMPVGIGRFCLLASAFLLGVLLLDLPAATGEWDR